MTDAKQMIEAVINGIDPMDVVTEATDGAKLKSIMSGMKSPWRKQQESGSPDEVVYRFKLPSMKGADPYLLMAQSDATLSVVFWPGGAPSIVKKYEGMPYIHVDGSWPAKWGKAPKLWHKREGGGIHSLGPTFNLRDAGLADKMLPKLSTLVAHLMSATGKR